MNIACPRLVIAGTGSGVGKTSITLGLARLLARRGLRVQTFKVGPDFLDPTYLALASGRKCYNLDSWMTSRDYVRQLVERTTANAHVILVEGVMGLFDGASPTQLGGSTAEIAKCLDAPVVLVVNAHGMARSLAAVVRGFAEFEPEVRVAGVIANQGGSARHRACLADALGGTAPLVGMMPRGALPTLPSRHLGLVTADAKHCSEDLLDQLADACEEHLDVEALLELGKRDQHTACADYVGHMACADRYVRLGIARDEAFHFYYTDNLEALERGGAELVPFSPLADSRLPEDLDALYFGGGYPEVHAARLAANTTMLADVRAFAASGRAVYAECGGLMYLGRALRTLDGARYPMAEILPIETAMLEKLKVLGYCEVTFSSDCVWGPAGQSLRGHEFHYSHVCEDHASEGWQAAYSVAGRRTSAVPGGFIKNRVLAGYPHLHWASRPDAVRHFLATIGRNVKWADCC